MIGGPGKRTRGIILRFGTRHPHPRRRRRWIGMISRAFRPNGSRNLRIWERTFWRRSRTLVAGGIVVTLPREPPPPPKAQRTNGTLSKKRGDADCAGSTPHGTTARPFRSRPRPSYCPLSSPTLPPLPPAVLTISTEPSSRQTAPYIPAPTRPTTTLAPTPRKAHSSPHHHFTSPLSKTLPSPSRGWGRIAGGTTPYSRKHTSAGTKRRYTTSPACGHPTALSLARRKYQTGSTSYRTAT